MNIQNEQAAFKNASKRNFTAQSNPEQLILLHPHSVRLHGGCYLSVTAALHMCSSYVFLSSSVLPEGIFCLTKGMWLVNWYLFVGPWVGKKKNTSRGVPTCPKALLPTEGTASRVHQVPKVPPACRGLIQRHLHGFGYPKQKQRASTLWSNTYTNIALISL